MAVVNETEDSWERKGDASCVVGRAHGGEEKAGMGGGSIELSIAVVRRR
jgi:hypothetical protein